MEIIPYDEKYKQEYIDLNTVWIEKYFWMEEGDKEILYHPEKFLGSGAMIYFALEDEQVLATCMTVPLEDGAWEICKLATDERFQKHGAGSAVLSACMDYAVAHEAKKLTLVSNHILEPALHLYEKFGFRQVPVERGDEYERVDVQYDYIVQKNI